MKSKIEIDNELNKLNKEYKDLSVEITRIHTETTKDLEDKRKQIRNEVSKLQIEKARIEKLQKRSKSYYGPELVFNWSNGLKMDTRDSKSMVKFMEMVLQFGMPYEYEMRGC